MVVHGLQCCQPAPDRQWSWHCTLSIFWAQACAARLVRSAAAGLTTVQVPLSGLEPHASLPAHITSIVLQIAPCLLCYSAFVLKAASVHFTCCAIKRRYMVICTATQRGLYRLVHDWNLLLCMKQPAYGS